MTFLGPEMNAASIALSVRGGFIANWLAEVAVYAVSDGASGAIFASGGAGSAIRGEGHGANGAVSPGIVGTAFTGGIGGGVIVTGGLIVTGAKSAAIKHRDGTTRAVYCEEAPESRLTDYGQVNLVAGRAEVQFAPDFTQIVKTDNYFVLVMPEGEANGLYITNKTARGFAVLEQKGDTANLVFTYRIAVRRSDIAGERLAKVTLPKARKVRKVSSATFPQTEVPPGAK